MARLTIQNALDLAWQHRQAGRLREAEQLYRQILAQQPEHAVAIHYLGVIAYQVGRNEMAVDLIRRAITITPNYPEAHNNLGNALHATGQLDEAIAAYRQAIALRPNYAGAHSNLGNALHAKGQLDEAIAVYRLAITIAPNYAEAYSNLGNALKDIGQLDEAIAACRQAIALRPEYAQAHNNLGNVLQDKGRLDEAIAAYGRAIAVRPNYPEAHNNLGNALQAKRQLDQSIAAYRQAIALRPNYAGAFSNLGNALQDKGQLDEAITAHRQAIALSPNYPEAHYNLGNALRAKGQLDESIAAYRRAIALRPGYAQAYGNLGNALQDTGQLDEAITAYRQAIALEPNYAEAHGNLGIALGARGRFDESIAACRAAIALRPDYAEAHNNLGIALQARGDFDEAMAAYRQAIVLRPNYAQAHNNLAQVRRFTADDPRLADLENLARDMASLREDERIPLHFALGKAYADLDRHEQASAHLLEGNALQRGRVRYDEPARLAWFDRVKAVFTPELMRQKEGLGDPSDVPVFILGMPRSGTTLIEQVLASHPKVFGAGELAEIAALVAEFSGYGRGPVRFPEAVPLLGPEELRGLGARYVRNISALARAAPPDTGRMPVPLRITDKTPDNFRFAGFIHLVLPHSRIIHARRDPVDTCLSCFSYLFTNGGLEWSYDLGELGRYYRAYAALMDHWRRVLPKEVMLDVQYEDLVTDFEPQARRIIAFCGLEWDDRCLAFHETKRPVHTASAVQVRQPIYRTSIGRWRPYKEMLKPLLDELGLA